MTGYIRDTWDCGNTLEVEEKHTGRYGAPGQKRGERRRATPEDIRRQNQWARERNLRRLIKWNFSENDYWITVTYRKGIRPGPEEMRRDAGKLIRAVREKYRQQGEELKYILRMEMGKRGSPHVHILVNRFANAHTGTDLIFSACWKKGHIHFRHTYEQGGYKELAEYIAKERQEWEPEGMGRFSTSKNLIRKEPTRKTIRRRALVGRNGKAAYPRAPKGYYVDPESVRAGQNPVTGYFYRHYTLVKIRRE